MAIIPQISRKRKSFSENDVLNQGTSLLSSKIELEMSSGEDEQDEQDNSDHDWTDPFPKLNTQSDTDDDDEDADEVDENEVEASSDEEYESEVEGDDAEEEGSDEEFRIFPEGKIITSKITGQPKKVYPNIEPDYDSDSSTEEDPNRVGNIPMHWYDDLPHIGYDINGKKVLRPAKGDELDKFLKTVDDSGWTTAFDKSAQTEKPLTSEELDIIRRLYANENPDAGYDPYEPTVEWFTGKGKEEVMPLSAAPEPKRRWVPSKWEKQKVMKIVRAIRQGRILPSKPKAASTQQQFYSIWSTPAVDHPLASAAPKVKLPTHAESYNPPEEYLPTEVEQAEWEATEKEEREQDFLPQKYNSLRLVPAYDQFIQQRFSRQLDLYMAPRVQRKKLDIDPDNLIPKLPNPNTLKPFPLYRALTFKHDKGKVRCLSISPDGIWISSGDEHGIVCLWEVLVGREVCRWKFNGTIGAIEWCPRTDVSYLIVGVDNNIHFLIPPKLSSALELATQNLLAPANLPPLPPDSSPVKWVSKSASIGQSNVSTINVSLPLSSGLIKQLSWHRHGDYVASVSGSEEGTVWIHQVSGRYSQAPFNKVKGSIQLVQFHPSKPIFFVATQRYVRMYDLSAQKLLKALTSGLKWISSMHIHPSGDHVIVGGYDRKLCWFDLELGDKPYKVIRYHSRAIRSVHFHPSYPLFASSSDDGTIQIFHSRVYNDLMTDPLIVPLKILRGHDVQDGLGVLQIKWCPGQPWLATAGADGTVCVWCN